MTISVVLLLIVLFSLVASLFIKIFEAEKNIEFMKEEIYVSE